MTQRQAEQIVELLWESLQPVKGYRDTMRYTGWGVKSQEGLIESIKAICQDT